MTEAKQTKLEKMLGYGWYEQLYQFLQSEAFKTIGQHLLYEARKGKDITPPFDLTFRAFKECSWSNLHTVILGMDPYPGKIGENYVADGIAFSSRLSSKCPKSLDYIFQALEEHSDANFTAEHYDLTKWANQGILLINCALSLPIGEKAGTHIKLWMPFISEVLRLINKQKEGVAFALMGRDARKYKPLLNNPTFGVFECEHPAAAMYNAGSRWNHENIFNRINGFQKFFNNIEIKWE